MARRWSGPQDIVAVVEVAAEDVVDPAHAVAGGGRVVLCPEEVAVGLVGRRGVVLLPG